MFTIKSIRKQKEGGKQRMTPRQQQNKKQFSETHFVIGLPWCALIVPTMETVTLLSEPAQFSQIPIVLPLELHL